MLTLLKLSLIVGPFKDDYAKCCCTLWDRSFSEDCDHGAEIPFTLQTVCKGFKEKGFKATHSNIFGVQIQVLL